MTPTIYTAGQLVDLLHVIVIANRMMNEDTRRFQDTGTSVLGAGIVVTYQAPKSRRTERKVLVEAPFQGNTGSRAACARALDFLIERGVDASWYDGAMD